MCTYFNSWNSCEGITFYCGSAGKESACNVGDLGLILGLGRSSGEGKGYPLQYSSLNSTDCTVHGITKSRTQLSNFRCSLKLPFSSLFYSVFWKHVSKFSPHSEGEGGYALPSGRGISMNYLNSSVGEIISSLPLIFLKNIYSIVFWLHGVLSRGPQAL